ncbi:MAG: nucleotidyltransferase [SAR324 cluster bacterium]|nr:nucleotidyltransferase [SAR324 cluster bacterium]
MRPTLVILAAGMGSRYHGLKQFDPIGPNQEILMDFAVFDAIRAGFGKVVFVIQKSNKNFFQKTIASRYFNHIEIDYAFQDLMNLPPGFQAHPLRIKPWGTGHAVLCSRKVVKEPFAVINADDFYGRTSFEIMNRALLQMNSDSRQLCMIGFPLGNTLSDHGPVSRGICSVENGILRALTERKKIERKNGQICYQDQAGKLLTLEPSMIVSMTFWGFSPNVLFPLLEKQFLQFLADFSAETSREFYLPDVIDSAIKSKIAEVKVLSTPECWLGLTFPEDKASAQEHIKQKFETGIYPRKMFEITN